MRREWRVTLAARDGVRYRLLGPIELSVDGTARQITSRRLRVLLAMLVLHRNQVVAPDRLTAALWGEHPPAGAARTLRTHLTRLRAQLDLVGGATNGGSTPRWRDHGYVLEVTDDQVDLCCFENLMIDARRALAPAEAVELLKKALRLWRGAALAEFADCEFARVEAARLEELRRRAVEELAAAELAAGRPGDALTRLDGHLAAHPLREQAWAVRMRALYRLGRQGESLAAYRDLRAVLVRELGVEPTPALQVLHEQVLRQDPALGSVDGHPARRSEVSDEARAGFPLPARLAGCGQFVGRVGELAALHAALARSAAGLCAMVLVEGEAGIGKTTLAFQAARAAHDHQSAVVLYGRCDEGLGRPYQPWAEALAHLLAHSGRAGVSGQTRSGLDPMLRPGEGAPRSVDPDTARHLLFSAVVAALAETARTAPVLLVLDDLQWADVPTLQLLRFVIDATEGLRLLVLGTFRSSEVDAHHPLAQAFAALHRGHLLIRLSLRGLGDGELLEWLERVSGHVLGPDGLMLRDALLAETDGNPFFIAELLRHLSETGADWKLADGLRQAGAELRSRGLPRSVREVIGYRVARLGPDVGRVLRMASVIGPDFDLLTLVGALETNTDEVVEHLATAEGAGLVVDLAAERYRFVHALIEHALYTELTPTRASRAHRRVAEAIQAQGEAAITERVGELARHWAAAADSAHALEYALRAGERALVQLAPAEAVDWFARARDLLGTDPPVRQRARLGVGLGVAQRQTGERRFRETLLEAAQLARACGAQDLMIAAALENNRGFASTTGVVDTERVAVLEAAAAVACPSSERAMLLALLAGELTYAPGDRRFALAAEAIELARSLGDPATLAATFPPAFFAAACPHTHHQRVVDADLALAAAGQVGDPVLEYWAVFVRWNLAECLAESALCVTLQDRLVELTGRIGQPLHQWTTGFRIVATAALRGDLAEADRRCDEVGRLGQQAGQPDWRLWQTTQQMMIRHMQGRSEEFLDRYAQSISANPGLPWHAFWMARLHAEAARPDAAREFLAPDAVTRLAALPVDIVWCSGALHAAAAIAHLQLAEAAAWLVAALEPFADQLDMVADVGAGAVGAALGRAAAVVGRHDEADAWFAQGIALADAGRHRWAAADARLAWGEALARRGSGRARGPLQEALTAAQRYGFGYIARTAGDLLRHGDAQYQ